MKRSLVLVLVFYPSFGSSFVCTHEHNHRRATISRSYATPNDDQLGPASLSKQDIILQEVLGIQPETDAQREERLTLRQQEIESRRRQKKASIVVAIFSFLVAAGNYFHQYTHPTTSLSLLTEMQQNSDPMTVIGRNGKPTVVEFWAPWCENCKASAPTLYSIETEYKGRVNFVHVDANHNDDATWRVIDIFGVDAIPHLAMVDADGDVQTALIGPIPRSVLRSDLDAMIENSKLSVNHDDSTINRQELPYTMYDAFQNSPENRHIRFN